MAQPVPSALVDAARCGSSLEIEQLLQAAWPVAYRLAYSVLGDRESAQDAAQESCVILYRTIASLRDPAAFRAWFYRIVVREASSLKRRHVELNVRKEPAQQIAGPNDGVRCVARTFDPAAAPARRNRAPLLRGSAEPRDRFHPANKRRRRPNSGSWSLGDGYARCLATFLKLPLSSTTEVTTNAI